MRSCSHARGFWPPSCRGGELRGDFKSGGGAMGSAPKEDLLTAAEDPLEGSGTEASTHCRGSE